MSKKEVPRSHSCFLSHSQRTSASFRIPCCVALAERALQAARLAYCMALDTLRTPTRSDSTKQSNPLFSDFATVVTSSWITALPRSDPQIVWPHEDRSRICMHCAVPPVRVLSMTIIQYPRMPGSAGCLKCPEGRITTHCSGKSLK